MIKHGATIALAVLLFSGSAYAQSTTAANPPPAATATAAPSMDKKARSKACSEQADKQGLHGKARKHFRSQCKAGKV